MTAHMPSYFPGRDNPVTREELAERGRELRDTIPFRGTALVLVDDGPTIVSCLLALEGWAGLVDLRGASPTETGTLQDSVVRGATMTPSEGSGSQATRWRIYSSGTTGRPTPSDHPLAALARQSRERHHASPARWGLLYSARRLAGIQVLLRVVNGDDLVDASNALDVDAKVALLSDLGVSALSATPTQWRQILQTPSSSRLDLTQVTLGGEIASQSLIDTLRHRFGARVTHVYASTEAGAVLSVSDGREGFPTDRLGDRVQIRGGILYVRAPQSSEAESDGFVRTDDVVEVRGDRVIFVGRASNIANVGGEKVAPEIVEARIRDHPHVREARVSSLPNRFSGSVLEAKVMVVPGAPFLGATELQTSVRAWVACKLSPAHVPAIVSVVDQLPSESGKIGRQ